MRGFPHEPSGRPDEGLLVLHLHEELDPTVAAALAAHLDECTDCRDALVELGARERRVGAVLRATDPLAYHPDDWAPVLATLRSRSARRRTPRPLLAAGAVIVLMATGIATPPVRAWIADGWDRVRGPVPAPVPAAPAASRAAVRFEAPGPVLDVVVTVRPAGGLLTIRWTNEVVAGVTVTNGGSERFEFGAGLLRIHDEPAARASYDVTVPVRVDRVRVRVGDGAVEEYSRQEHAARRIVVDLAGG